MDLAGEPAALLKGRTHDVGLPHPLELQIGRLQRAKVLADLGRDTHEQDQVEGEPEHIAGLTSVV